MGVIVPYLKFQENRRQEQENQSLNEPDSKNDIVALQVWVGQNAVTSDYVHITSSPIDVILDDSINTIVGSNVKEFFPAWLKAV